MQAHEGDPRRPPGWAGRGGSETPYSARDGEKRNRGRGRNLRRWVWEGSDGTKKGNRPRKLGPLARHNPVALPGPGDLCWTHLLHVSHGPESSAPAAVRSAAPAAPLSGRGSCGGATSAAESAPESERGRAFGRKPRPSASASAPKPYSPRPHPRGRKWGLLLKLRVLERLPKRGEMGKKRRRVVFSGPHKPGAVDQKGTA